MFCTNCGSQVPETANFCVGCGTPARHAQETSPPPTPAPPAYALPPQPSYSAAPPPAPVAQPSAPQASTGKCAWCGATVDGTQNSCPQCGAALNVRSISTKSGWVELPGRKDMAKLQFGNSICQISGLFVPVADMNLAAGDGVYFSHHVLLWKDPAINITTMPLKGAWKRMFAGLPLIMTQAQGPGHIAFSHDAPGEMIALPLHPGQAIDVREHLFLTATANVQYDWFDPQVWFTTQNGDDQETHYPVGMFMDRFAAQGAPGLLLLHAAGNVFVRELAPHQTILVKPTALIFKDPSVQMQLHFEHPSTFFSGWGRWSNKYLWLRLTGPGRVAVQSVFERLEGEAGNIQNFSYATEQRW